MSKISNPFGAGAFSTASAFGNALAISPVSHVGEPLDLTTIGDASTQILFKNLSKKENENTKVKALEELSNIIESSSERGIEEGVLSAWMRLYPRLSVDLSRRVRQLTHTLHAAICCANKKKIAKFMPQISGAWLCGTYDNDRTVAKVARESLIKTFTLEKLKKVWEVYHSDILSYCTNIIEREQVYTLSSETQGKNVEDAEAKFARVIGACISALRHLLMDIPQESISKEESVYQEFFGKPRLWEFAYHTDPSVRSAVYNLLRACLKRHQGYLEPLQDILAKNIITKSFPIAQLGSVSDYLDALIELTEAYPHIWLQVKGKKTNKTVTLLGQFVSQGPQGAQPDFWPKINRLFEVLPEEVIPQDRQSIEDFLDAYMHGINGPTVSKAHAVLSWTSYFGVCSKLLSLKGLPSEVNQMILVSRIIPVYEGYILQQENSNLKIIGPLATAACVNGLLKLSPEKNLAFSDPKDSTSKNDGLEATYLSLWDSLEGIVFSRVKTLENPSDISPEVLSVGTRWLELLSEFYKLLPDDSLNAEKLIQSIRNLVKISLENLERHKDDVSMFAVLFEKAITISPPSIWKDQKLHLATEDFFSAQLPNLHPSPVASVIIKAMLHWFRFTDSTDTIEALWTENINALLSSKEDNKAGTIGAILRDFPPELHGKVPSIPELVKYVLHTAQKAVDDGGDTNAWSITTSALKIQGTFIPESTTTQILEIITKKVTGLDPHKDQNSGVLMKLEFIAQNHLHSLLNFAQNFSSGPLLLLQLLRLEGLDPDQDNSAVKRIWSVIDSRTLMSGSTQDARGLTLTVAKIIVQAVSDRDGHDQNSIPVDFLASKALHLFHHAHGEEKLSVLNALTFPDDSWSVQNAGNEVSLRSLLEKTPRVGVDLANPLGGCVHLIESGQNELIDEKNSKAYHAQRLLRVATYTLKLIEDTIFFGFIDKNTRVLIFLKLLLTAEWSKDNLQTSDQDSHVRVVVSKFVSQVQSLMAERLKSHHGFFSETGHGDVDLLGQELMKLSRGRSVVAFYGSRVLYWLLSELVEIHGCSQKTAEGFIENLRIRNTEEIFLAVSFLLALSRPLKKSKLAENLLNSLASDVSGITLVQIPKDKVPPKLVLLNSLMSGSSNEEINFPTQRAMFLLRNMLTWFDLDGDIDTQVESEVNESLISETAKLLKNLVPIIKDVYGSHWKSLCSLVLMGWMCSSTLYSATYWCMKLYEVLKHSCAGNDDFEDAVNDNTKQFNRVLIKMFESVHGPTDDPSAEICYTLLARLVRNIPIAEFTSMDGVYPLLRGMPNPIHETAYELLHQYIPLQQEQISLEAALAGEDDEFAPQLAPELLSLLLDTPPAEALEDLVLDEKLLGEPGEESVRGCFLAWRLIFDHFEKATFKVKSAYTANLQEGGYLDKFLDLVFEFIGISQGRSFEPNREMIKYFPIDEEDWSSAKSIKQLLVHLYYLSLLNTPSLVKTWFMDQTNRQTSNGVETFTEKYISPLIIDTELTAISSWASGELPSSSAAALSSSDIEIQVRVSRSVREVTITCPVDEQVMELLIRLPHAFPLRKPEIEGIRKVGFTELQWKAIQLASHAVIALQGGSIIDAVMLFRKNVTLHFEGVEECAICYSIIGQERTVPGKQCVTCKKKFHAGCLFKWFKTSNSSTCPMCRSGWQFYGRVNR